MFSKVGAEAHFRFFDIMHHHCTREVGGAPLYVGSCCILGIEYDPDRDKAVWQDSPGNSSIADDARCLIDQYSNLTVGQLNLTVSHRKNWLIVSGNKK